MNDIVEILLNYQIINLVCTLKKIKAANQNNDISFFYLSESQSFKKFEYTRHR